MNNTYGYTYLKPIFTGKQTFLHNHASVTIKLNLKNRRWRSFYEYSIIFSSLYLYVTLLIKSESNRNGESF